MIIDGIRFARAHAKTAQTHAINAFVELIERKLGIVAVYDSRTIPFGRPELIEAARIADRCVEGGIIRSVSRALVLPDEPPLRIWICELDESGNTRTGGASVDDDASALTAALAESIERYIWLTQRDYFVRPVRATAGQISKKYSALLPERFVSFSKAQRSQAKELQLAPDAEYLWIQGRSLVTGKPLYVPAQVASAAVRPLSDADREPLIRVQSTIGLATWPERDGALVAGALECFERESYMIMWLNQLTLPRARLSSLRARSAGLDTLVTRCERYGLKVHIVPMLTDAPTHAVCAVIEDGSGSGPRFAFGLKAHRSLPYAAERALTEAMRARLYPRSDVPALDPALPVERVGHLERLLYWNDLERSRKLEFLIQGEEREMADAPWEHDSASEQLARIVSWCREKGYECVSVPMGTSKINPTPWHIEMVLMPDLQPTYLAEHYRHLDGARLRDVPASLGYTPRKELFLDMPHPYA